MLKSWLELPEQMRNDEVKKYYKILSKKKSALRIKRIADVFLAFIFMILLSPSHDFYCMLDQNRQQRTGILPSGKNHQLWQTISYF